MGKVHVLHVSRAVNTGLAHCVADHVKHQVESGLRVTVACPSGRLGDLAGRHGAGVAHWNAVREPGIGMAAEAARLRGIIRRARPDVVHLHCAKAGLLGRLVLRRRIPTVFSPHSWSFVGVDGPVQRASLAWERFAARWSTVVMCVSAAERDGGQAAGITGRFEVLPNEIEIAVADTVRARPRDAVRADLGILPGVPVAVCAARLSRQKGQDALLAAWDGVRKRVPGAELVLVGDGPDRLGLETIAGPGVRFTGAVDRLTSQLWMYAANVVVCPSRWEGMSLVPLEAMALGRPLVVTDVDGMAEAVPPEAGQIVPVDDVLEIERAVSRMLAYPAAAEWAGRAGRELAEARAARRESAERLVAIYRELGDPAGRAEQAPARADSL